MNRQPPSHLRTPALLAALALLAASCGKEDKPAAQAPPAAQQAPARQATAPAPAQPQAAPAAPPQAAANPAPPPGKPLSELESLVAPIALYPDPLLAELLVASTYPLEVVQADRWLAGKPDLNTLKDKSWDASIMRLVDVPQVLKMMSEHLDWTTQLGNTFLAQPDKLMDAIQDLRRRARQSGFLKDTPEQKVSVKAEDVRVPAETAAAPAGDGMQAKPAVYKKDVVYIEPAKSDTLYVPQYKPEAAYQAPLAPPPASSAQYYPATAPAPSYYPAATTTTTTTSSSSNDLMTFGMGALAGGLLTWGIMEWAHHDDDYYGYGYGYRGGYYPAVGHYYGGSVCRYGNCWNGGGAYRGNVNYNRNTNISGNEINIDRSRSFSQDQLANFKSERQQPWTHDVQHRRGAEYPQGLRDRMGQVERPALAGERLGSAQTLPANVRGFGEAGAGLAGAGLGGERRPSSDQIRDSLSKGTRLQDSIGGNRLADRAGQPRPATSDLQPRRAQGQGGLGEAGGRANLAGRERPSAFEGVRDSGAAAKAEQRRGAQSLGQRQGGAGGRADLAGRQRPQQATPKAQPRREMPQQSRAERPQATGGRDFSQAREQQRRTEAQRPNAFDGARDQGRAQDFSKRGAASRENMASRSPSGGGFQGGGGLQNRGGGGFQGGGFGGRGGGAGFQGGGGFGGRGGGGGFQGGGGFGGRGGGGGGGFRGRR